jgi:hypothetical protein
MEDEGQLVVSLGKIYSRHLLDLHYPDSCQDGIVKQVVYKPYGLVITGLASAHTHTHTHNNKRRTQHYLFDVFGTRRFADPQSFV